jgi:hypothetical protein
VSTSGEAFARLGLTEVATLDEIRRAWKAEARRLHPDAGGDEAAMQRLNAAYDICRRYVAERQTASVEEPEVIVRDAPSFVVEALPVVTFEALLIATSWLGDVLVDEPPYVLEVHLDDPAPCWCRLELVPDAGATTVSLTVAGVDGGEPPSAIAVRDRWISVLNALPLPE